MDRNHSITKLRRKNLNDVVDALRKQSQVKKQGTAATTPDTAVSTAVPAAAKKAHSSTIKRSLRPLRPAPATEQVSLMTISRTGPPGQQCIEIKRSSVPLHRGGYFVPRPPSYSITILSQEPVFIRTQTGNEKRAGENLVSAEQNGDRAQSLGRPKLSSPRVWLAQN